MLRKRRSVLLKYLLGYITAVTVVITMLVPVYYTALNSIKQNSMEAMDKGIAQGVLRLEKSFEAMISINDLLRSSTFSTLKNMGDDDFLLPNQSSQYQLIRVRDMFSAVTKNVDFVLTSYLLFHNNSKVITASATYSNTIYMDNRDFFEKYMVYSQYDDIYDEIVNLNKTVAFIPSTWLTINLVRSANCVTLITRPAGSAATVCAVYPAADLLNLFGMNDLPAESYLILTESSGGILLSQNAEYQSQAGYTRIETEIPLISGTVVVGIPESYFVEQTSATRHLVDGYLIASVIIGLLLAVALAVVSYMPIYRLVKLNESNTATESMQGDFEYLRTVSNHFARTNRSLENTVNLMERAMGESALLNLLMGTDAGSVPVVLLPEINHVCRICIIDTGQDRSEIEAEKMSFSIYTALCKENLRAVYITNTQLAVLVEERRRQELLDSVAGMAEAIEEEYASRLTTVLSYEFQGVQHIRETYLQTQLMAIYSYGGVFYVKKPSRQGFDINSYVDLRRLKAVMWAGKEDEVRQIFKDSLSSLIEDGGSFDDVKGLYSVLSAAPSAFLAEGTGRLASHTVPIFMENAHIERQFDILCEVCISVMQQNRVSDEQMTYKGRLMQYIRENYTNSELSAGMLSEMYQISAKQVYLIVRESTGVGYADYIENLRMSRAAELLKTTGMPINDVAVSCGYYSINTFYKAFKKIYGCPPSIFRKRG